MHQYRFAHALFMMAWLAAGCSGGGGDEPAPPPLIPPPAPVNATVTLSWAANPDTELNKAGGGYRVYYSQNANFQPGDPGVQTVDVPYAAGAQAPTTIDISITTSGTWYFRVQGYSMLNPQGSALSDPVAAVVPAP